MRTRIILLVGSFAFLLSFGFETGKHWIRWQRGVKIEPACDFNLKALWVIARHCSVRYRLSFPPPPKIIQTLVDSGYSLLLTSRTATYLGSFYREGDHVEFRGTLLCARDPDYSLKMAKMTQGLDYQPSYQWHPDSRTLAYCPYCGLAVLLDGKLEKRTLTKP